MIEGEATNGVGEASAPEGIARGREPLATLTTMGVGGAPRFFARAATIERATEAARWARERDLPLLVLGGGSNLLVADGEFPGLALKVEIGGVRSERRASDVLVTAGAGEDWDRLVARCVGDDLAGFECLSGIPGSVGATPIQNVGAYGQDVAETIERVRALDLETYDVVAFANHECGFGYRTSRFKHRDAGRYVVLDVTYRLRPGGEPTVRYAELQRALARTASPSLADVRDEVLRIRRAKSMVFDPADADSRGCGSFFTNPILDEAAYARFAPLAATALGPGERVPVFPAGEGSTKLAAGWLIERAGFERGHARGRAALSSKHALAITNRGGATAAEVVALAREVRDRVRERLGVTLVPEPVFVGLSLDD